MTATMRTLQNPLKNSRGAIMVIGIFFACMMIGWMWMLVGLGDAMIWRDRSQEAADALSYSSAAVQAQGMNLISFLNVLMLILTTVYLLMSFVYNILDLFHALLGSSKDKEACMQSSCGARKNDTTLLSMVPYFEWLEPIASQWCNAADIVGQLHDGNTNGAPSGGSLGGLYGKYEKDVMVPVLPALSKFEDFVSYATPWAGELVGMYMGTQYKDWGKSRIGLPISSTLIPATTSPGQPGTLLPAHKYQSCDDDEWEKEGKCVPKNCDAHDPGNCAPYDGGDKREGLPVAIPDSGFKAVCDYAGAKISDEAKNMISGLVPGPVGSALGTIVGFVMGSLGEAMADDYCTQDGEGLFSSLEFPIDLLIDATAVQGGGWKNKEKCPNDNWGHGNSGTCGGPKQCLNVYDMKLNDGNQFWENPKFAGGPHLVVDYAANGNDWMQVWGAVWGGNRVEQAEKLVGVAGMDSSGAGSTWNTVIPQNSESMFSFYMAQSEFYFDCEDKWGEEECNKDSNASYNMNWRARLRRMHGVSWGQDLLGYVWGGSLGSTFDSRVTEIVGGAIGSSFSDPMTGRLAQTGFNQAYTFVKSWAGDQVGSMFQPASAVPDFIH